MEGLTFDPKHITKMRGPTIGKIDVKWINGEWNAFFPDLWGGVIRTAGVMDIIDQVNERWHDLESGRVLQWTATDTKFVVREVDAAATKLSKSDG